MIPLTPPSTASDASAAPRRSTWQRLVRRIRVPLGFAFAALFLALARPTPRSLAWSLLLVVPGLLLRGYASGYVRKNQELATTGPYAYTRNPLYLGSLLLSFGFALSSRSPLLTSLLVALFAGIYLPTILAEEQFLRAHFPGFDVYCRSVPRLIPRLTPAPPLPSQTPDRGQFSPALYRQHREYNSLIGAAAIYAALVARLVLLWQR